MAAIIQTMVNYLDPSVKEPFRYWTNEDGKMVKHTNIVYKPQRVIVHNIRECLLKPDLQNNGFTYLKQKTAVTDFYNDEHVRDVYYKEVMQLVKDMTGAEIVSPFKAGCGNIVDTHCIRSRKQGYPIFEVHVDQTKESGEQRLEQLFPGKYKDRRVQVINVWRPVKGPLNDVPLAVVDAATVNDQTDLAYSSLKYADLDGSTYKVYYNEGHAWYYMPAMEVDDVMLFKCYDSDETSKTRFAPHSAILDPTVSKFIMRESIEMRILAII